MFVYPCERREPNPTGAVCGCELGIETIRVRGRKGDGEEGEDGSEMRERARTMGGKWKKERKDRPVVVAVD